MSQQLDIEQLRRGYLSEKATFEKLADSVAQLIRTQLKEAGVSAPVTFRVKELASVIRKALDKHEQKPEQYADPIGAMKDKAGVRIVVLDLKERNLVDAIVRSLFPGSHCEDKGEALQPHEIGYLGWHYDVVIPTSLLGNSLELEGKTCEVQIHTKAQNAWTDQSHAITYKSGPIAPSPAISRRLNQALVLIELFDREVDSVRALVLKEPGYEAARLFEICQQHFLSICDQNFDSRLSMQILTGMVSAYTEKELENLKFLETFCEAKRPTIKQILAAYPAESSSLLLRQPEVFIIYERVTSAPTALKHAWSRVNLPISLLSEVCGALGVPLD